MSPGNMFKVRSTTEYKVKAPIFHRERPKNNPFTDPHEEQKKKAKKQANSLVDFNLEEDNEADALTFFDRVILYFATIIGKKQQWNDTRKRLRLMKNRINTFETIINGSKSTSYLHPKFKNVQV